MCIYRNRINTERKDIDNEIRSYMTGIERFKIEARKAVLTHNFKRIGSVTDVM